MRGITIQLLQRTQTGVDPFKQPIYEEDWVDVDNVLIGEPSSEAIIDEVNLTGKHIAYVLGIPKGDDHIWNDTEVMFWGERFRTIGYPTKGIDELIPLDWNKKVRVERYG